MRKNPLIFPIGHRPCFFWLPIGPTHTNSQKALRLSLQTKLISPSECKPTPLKSHFQENPLEPSRLLMFTNHNYTLWRPLEKKPTFKKIFASHFSRLVLSSKDDQKLCDFSYWLPTPFFLSSHWTSTFSYMKGPQTSDLGLIRNTNLYHPQFKITQNSMTKACLLKTHSNA